MKYILLLLMFTKATFALVDYKVQTSMRSYPKGAGIEGDLGYSFKLWEKNKILYGYLRPSVQYRTSAIVNYGSVQMDLFPVSFFGLYAGHLQGRRALSEVQGFDCTELNCNSELYKNYLGANLALKYKKVSFLNLYRFEDIHYQDEGELFGEEFTNLILSKDDSLSINTTVLGYDINDKILIGALYLWAGSNTYSSHTTMGLGITQYTHEKWQFQVGAGRFRNTLGKDHFTSIFIIKFNGAKGYRLF